MNQPLLSQRIVFGNHTLAILYQVAMQPEYKALYRTDHPNPYYSGFEINFLLEYRLIYAVSKEPTITSIGEYHVMMPTIRGLWVLTLRATDIKNYRQTWDRTIANGIRY